MNEAAMVNLMASMAYSTWINRPSGLKVLTPRSYSLLVRNILTKHSRAALLRAQLGSYHDDWKVLKFGKNRSI